MINGGAPRRGEPQSFVLVIGNSDNEVGGGVGRKRGDNDAWLRLKSRLDFWVEVGSRLPVGSY